MTISCLACSFLKKLQNEAKNKLSSGPTPALSLEGKEFDSVLLSWANDTVQRRGKISGLDLLGSAKTRRISGFSDPQLGDALFLLDLLYAVEPRVVDWRVVDVEGEAKGTALSEAQCLSNARYCINAARSVWFDVCSV